MICFVQILKLGMERHEEGGEKKQILIQQMND